jgi:hypothetical protein
MAIRHIILAVQKSKTLLHLGPTFIVLVLVEKCDRNILFLSLEPSHGSKHFEIFSTFKQPFATHGEWRMGWTTLYSFLMDRS